MTIVLSKQGGGQLAPLPAINVRRFPRGEGLHEKAKLDPPTLIATAAKLLIFVHGYNNTRFEAEKSYGVFRSKLTKLPGFTQAGFYWPGDKMRRQVIELLPPPEWETWLSTFYYERQVDSAVRSGKLLANAVAAEIDHRRAQARIAGRLSAHSFEICIVAHSLGCRVTLEFLQRVSVLPGV